MTATILVAVKSPSDISSSSETDSNTPNVTAKANKTMAVNAAINSFLMLRAII
jgi:hypothetical protein